MRGGRLRNLVTIQTPTEGSADDYGETTDTWAKLAHVWAEVRTLQAGELFRYAQVQPEATVAVTMRYRDDVTTQERILHGTRYLYPKAILPDERLTEMTVLCGEQL